MDISSPHNDTGPTTGRDNILDAIKRILGSKSSSSLGEVPICVLCGLGGIGKTFLANKYILGSSEQSTYGLVWWIKGYSSSSIVKSFVSFNKRLGLPASTKPTICIVQVKQWLEASCMIPIFNPMNFAMTFSRSIALATCI